METLRRCFVLLILISGTAHEHFVWAYDIPAHEQISGRATNVSIFDRSLKDDLGFSDGQDSVFGGKSALRWIRDGAGFEDVPDSRVLNHFHNPLASTWDEAGLRMPLFFGLLNVKVGQSSVLWQQNRAQDTATVGGPLQIRVAGGNWSWQDTRERYVRALTGQTKAEREQAFADVFRGLGQLMHLVQDASLPAHVRNDGHLYKTVFGFDVGNPDSYERWVDKNLNLILGFISQPPKKFEGVFGSTGNNTGALVPVARLIDTDLYLGSDSGLLAGTSIGMAEYANGNFLSGDTNSLPYNGSLGNFPFPAPTSVALGQPESDPKTNELRRYLLKVRDGDTGYRLAVPSALYNLLPAALKHKWLGLDENVLQDYAARLLPRAVGYSAGLLDYFFRGKLDVDVVEDSNDPSIIQVTGMNASPEKLDGGTLTLYADDPSGIRAAATAVDSNMTVSADPGAPVNSARFQAPPDAERFVAVYQGTLGNEVKDPDRNFPGGVIGKVLGGVRVEQVFLDGDQWKIRTPKGVFLLKEGTRLLTGTEFEEVKWGDGENLLVARTPLGPEKPNQIIAYEVPRQPNSVELVSETMPDGPVVTLTQKNSAVFPFGMSLGTTVNYSQTVEYSQRLARYDPRKTVFRWKPNPKKCPTCGDYEFDHYEFGPLSVETVHTQTVPFVESFEVVLDLAHSFFGAERQPYVWDLRDIATDASGRFLGVVVIYLGTPTSPPATVPFFRVNREGGFEASSLRLEPFFPSGFTPLLWTLVDLKMREVVASTAESSISLTFQQRIDTLPDVYGHFFTEAIGGGPNDGIQDLGWFYLPLVRPPEEATLNLTDVETTGGIVEIAVTGWPKAELARLRDEQTGRGLFEISVELLSQSTTDFAYDCVTQATGVSCQAIRYRQTTTWEQPPLARLNESRRSRPAPGRDRFVVLTGGHVLLWDPATPSARILFQLPPIAESGYFLGPTTESASMVFGAGQKSFLIPLSGEQPPVIFPEDLSFSFTLLEPSYLYNIDDLKFYRPQPPLQRTPLPAKLAEVPGGNPFGDFHAVRVP